MRFFVKFKTPDVIEDAIRETVCQEEIPDEIIDGYAIEEKCKALAAKFIRHGELITVEFDTEAGTATVVPVDS